MAARSGRTHVYDTSSTLDLLGRRMAVLRLSGYVFFGSSTGLGNSVLQLAARMLQVRACGCAHVMHCTHSGAIHHERHYKVAGLCPSVCILLVGGGGGSQPL